MTLNVPLLSLLSLALVGQAFAQAAPNRSLIRIPANLLYFWNYTENITLFRSPYFLPFPVNRDG